MKGSRLLRCDPQSDHRVDCLVRVTNGPMFEGDSSMVCTGVVSVVYTSSTRPRIGTRQYGWDCD